MTSRDRSVNSSYLMIHSIQIQDEVAQRDDGSGV